MLARWSKGVAVVVAVIGLASATGARARHIGSNARLFESLAGVWSGAGTASLASGTERLRCRAAYAPVGPTRLHLDLRCGGDSFALQVQSDIVRDGDRVSGTWTETTFGVSGVLSGSVLGGSLRATVAGMGMSALLSLSLRGNTQAVMLASQSTLASSASVTLQRE